MGREKFQQKALQQAKQKKSKSAEFLMVGKDERVAAEGTANPAFNISCTDLSAYQTSEEEVIRHDKLDSTLAAHREKRRLQTRNEPRGNECSRNYFDPLMDEEINPRQCGMEVTKEVPLKLDERLLYDKLMTFLDEENRKLAIHDTDFEKNHDEDAFSSAWPFSGDETCDLGKEVEDEETLAYTEQFDNDVQDEIILLSKFSLEQDLKYKDTSQSTKKFKRRLSKVFPSKKESQALKAALNTCKEKTASKLSNLIGLNNDSNGGAVLGWKADWPKKAQPIQIQLKCLRGLKDKVPQGSYSLKVSLHEQLGGKSPCWSKLEGQQWAGTSLPVKHNGNFFDVEIYLDQSVYINVPVRKDWKPGEILLFEFFLLRGTNTCIDRAVGWGAFPLCNNNLDTVDGKFKCPLLRGHYNSKINRFQKIENFISSDLDHWLCNLYFQIIKLPQYSEEQNRHESGQQLSSNTVLYSNIAEKNGASENGRTGGLQNEGLESSLSQCPSGCSTASQQGGPLTPLRDSDTHKGSIPTVEKEVGKQFNAVRGWEQCMLKEAQRKRKVFQLLKCFQQADEAVDKFKSNVKDQMEPHGKGNDPFTISTRYSDTYCEVVPVKETHGTNGKMNPNGPNDAHGHRNPGTRLDAGEALFCCTSYLEELEKHRFSVCDRSTVGAKAPTSISKHVYFTVYAVFSELGTCWYSWNFWFTLLLLTALWFFHLYLRYSSQWVFLQAIAVPVTRFQFHLYTVDLCYQNSLVHASEELAVIMVGPLTLNVIMLLLVLMRWGCQLLFGSFPSCMSKLIMAWGLWTVLDPMAVFAVDALLGRLHYTPDKPIADCAKLYWLFLRMEESGIPGVLITVLLYTLLFFISSTILFLYSVRIHNDGWLLDMLQRIQNDEATFFVPFDLEISNQELSYIVKKAEQWRGINGERRKVVVYDCIWKDHAKESGICSSNIHHQDEILKSAGNSGSTTVHVIMYTVHPGGFQNLYRHFLRLPSGAIVEAFGDISGINFAHNEVSAATQEHVSEMDNALGASSAIKRWGKKKNAEKWKGNQGVSNKS